MSAAYKSSDHNVLINDDGTMRMTTVQTLKTYIGGGDNTPYFAGRKASAQVITRNTQTNITGFTSGEIDSDSAFDGETFTVPSPCCNRRD